MKYSTCVLLGLLGLSSGHDTRHHESSGNLRTKHHDPSTENRGRHSGNGRAKPRPEEARQVPPEAEGRIHQHGGVRSHDHSPRSTGLLNLTDTYDDFEPELVEICSTDTSFQIGDNCEVSLYLDDLLETEFDHIFETKCSDDDVIITMDLEDNIPSHVTRMHPYSGHWTELIAVPEAGDFDGCLYFAIVSNADIDPDKETEELGDEHRRKLSHNGQALGEFQFGQDSFFPFATRPEGRKLESCSQYTAIRVAIQYDSVFCTETGGGTAEGAKAAIHSIINTMNKFYQASPLCFTVQSCDIKGYCSASSDPLQGVLQSAATFCGSGGNTLVDTFKAHVNGDVPDGCDTTHMLFGASLQRFGNTAGCAGKGALCNEHAIGTVNAASTRPQMSNVKIFAHELGHNLNLADHYPEDTTYIMGTGGGDAGFKPERMSIMQDYVTQKRQENPSCTAVTSQVVDLDTDGLYIKPDVAEGPACAARKAMGHCDAGSQYQSWTLVNCATTCNAKDIPVYPDVDSGPDCAARKRSGYCENPEYKIWAMETCSTTCSLDKIPIFPDTNSPDQCKWLKADGLCEDKTHQSYSWMWMVCSTTCSTP